MKKREYTLWAADFPTAELRVAGLSLPTKPPSEGLGLLHQFCQTGEWPQQEGDHLTKELLYYYMLDMFAQINNIGAEDTTKKKSAVPSMIKLVCCSFLTLECPTCHSLFRVTQVSTTDLNSSILLWESSGKNLQTTLDVMCKDLQLHHCFHNLRIASKCVHQSNFMHNFAAAGFHLCYLLKVHTCANLEQAVFDKFIARTISICLKIRIL
jgi:hypothetical protein